MVVAGAGGAVGGGMESVVFFLPLGVVACVARVLEASAAVAARLVLASA